MSTKQLQRHLAVPSSNAPPIKEWADHLWYTIRNAALQARPDLTDAEAALLVAHMESYIVVTPCKDCRKHYADDWATHPFTLAHARDATKAMSWTEELRLRIEKRKAAERRSGAAPAAAAATTLKTDPTSNLKSKLARDSSTALKPAPVPAARAPAPAPLPRPLRRPFGIGSAGVSGPSRSTSKRQTRPTLGSLPAHRRLAIQSAMLETGANRRGRAGCNCGGKRGKAAT